MAPAGGPSRSAAISQSCEHREPGVGCTCPAVLLAASGLPRHAIWPPARPDLRRHARVVAVPRRGVSYGGNVRQLAPTRAPAEHYSTLSWSGWRDSNPRPPAPKLAPAGRLTELHVVQCGAYLGLCWLDVAQHRVMAVPAGPHSGSHQCCPGTRLLPIELNLEFEARSRYSGSQRPSCRRWQMLSRSPSLMKQQRQLWGISA